MRRSVVVLFVALLASAGLLVGARAAIAAPAAADEAVEIDLYGLETCPHCHAAREFLEDLATEVPGVVVRYHELTGDRTAQLAYTEAVESRGESPGAVPAIVLGERLWIGFSASTADAIRDEVERRLAAEDVSAPAEAPTEERDTVDVPFVGAVDVGSSSLLTSTVVIAFVDGVNPCSLWVLSVLLALVLHSGSRGRVALVGTTFLTVTTALYGLYIVGAYSLLSYVSYLTWVQRLVAAVILVFGAVNLRDAMRAAPATLAIPGSAKPGIYRRGRALVSPERSVLGVMAGTVVLAAGVSLAETPCSAALPLLWTNLLAAADPGAAVAASLFALYMAIFLIDELLLFGAVVVTMRAARLQQHHDRLLRLVTGAVMVGLAVAMLAAPELLESVTGTLVVFGGAALVVAVLLVGRRFSALLWPTSMPSDGR
ncbi:glutaredoxin family protein [Acidimicrobiia bacterium EGI L10123]|uniref:glutaredoxin family protein n=1 Tax=Salinilacustrithrix flava TaxID=2957203 RepID=UPI003D7C214B|nr:glutaredoxin family protein [Acidimicrobiia bacterium EGI L10123]